MNTVFELFVVGVIASILTFLFTLGITNNVWRAELVERNLAHWEANPKYGTTTFVITNLNAKTP